MRRGREPPNTMRTREMCRALPGKWDHSFFFFACLNRLWRVLKLSSFSFRNDGENTTLVSPSLLLRLADIREENAKKIGKNKGHVTRSLFPYTEPQPQPECSTTVSRFLSLYLSPSLCLCLLFSSFSPLALSLSLFKLRNMSHHIATAPEARGA